MYNINELSRPNAERKLNLGEKKSSKVRNGGQNHGAKESKNRQVGRKHGQGARERKNRGVGLEHGHGAKEGKNREVGRKHGHGATD